MELKPPTNGDLLGEPGTNGQHSFYQLIHQGTKLIPVIYRVCPAAESARRHHDLLLANVLAQAEALAFGKTPQDVRAEGTPAWQVPHRTFEGNRPSSTLLLERLIRWRWGSSSHCTNTASSLKAHLGH